MNTICHQRKKNPTWSQQHYKVLGMTSGNVFSVCKSIEWIKFMDWTLLCKCTPLTTILWIHFKLNIYLGLYDYLSFDLFMLLLATCLKKIEVFWPPLPPTSLFFLNPKFQPIFLLLFLCACLSNAMGHLYVIFSSKLINLTFFMKWKLYVQCVEKSRLRWDSLCTCKLT